jgi:hypothetical protein
VFGVQEGLSMAALALGLGDAPIVVNRIGSTRPSSPGLALLVRGCSPCGGSGRSTTPRRWPIPRTSRCSGEPFALRPVGAREPERVARHLSPVEVEAGATVIVEGEPGDRFYLIADGSLEVFRGGVPLAKLGPGDFVGEIALLRNVPRTATVIAAEPSSLRALDRDHFLAAVTGSPAGVVALAQEIDRRVAEHDD